MKQIIKDLAFVEDYISASNAATGSKYDSNANVTNKNVATLAAEIHKGKNITINRHMMVEGLTQKFGKELGEEYLRQLESHEIYKHDETSSPGVPYCVSISMYPFLIDGLKSLGGDTSAPQNLQSFNGSFINLCFLVASQFAGALATPEYLMYTDYFIRKEFGDDYYTKLDKEVYVSHRPHTIKSIIEDGFQQVVYSLNQPASARGFQSIFHNIAYFDSYYFDSMFGDFIFPDGSKPQWESLSALQKLFMKWFNNERRRQILTFPVETLSLLHKDGKLVDTEWAEFAAEMLEEGHSFFIYTSDSVDSLASCCRLRNEFVDNTFSYSLGAGGVATGSKSVITLNMNRLVQNTWKENYGDEKPNLNSITNFYPVWQASIKKEVEKIHKYHEVFNDILVKFYKANMLPVFSAGYISLDKQFLTIGLNGLLEAAEFLGFEITDSPKYIAFLETSLKPIYDANKAAKTKDLMFNTEFIPGENLGVKHYKWDKEAGYKVPSGRNAYNSYFYIVEDYNTNILQKFNLHGEKVTHFLDGGSALHANLDEHLTKEQYLKLLNYAASVGCSYFTFNIPNTVCNDCGHITKHNLSSCPECGSINVDKLTRIIGYLKRISNFSEPRQVEAHRRYYGKGI